MKLTEQEKEDNIAELEELVQDLQGDVQLKTEQSEEQEDLLMQRHLEYQSQHKEQAKQIQDLQTTIEQMAMQ